jgi:hypothetical protein
MTALPSTADNGRMEVTDSLTLVLGIYAIEMHSVVRHLVSQFGRSTDDRHWKGHREINI